MGIIFKSMAWDGEKVDEVFARRWISLSTPAELVPGLGGGNDRVCNT